MNTREQDKVMEGLAAGVLANAAKPRERSETMPAGVYTERAFMEFEKREVFSKEWISLCHLSQIPKAGDFVRVEVADEPMLVIRGKDLQVRVVSRVCRHRGMDLMPPGAGHPDLGNRRVILCPYHLWSYDLTGRLVGVPEMQEAEGFDRSEVCLHQFRSDIWEGFVFVTLSEETPPLAEKYGRLKDEFLGKWNLGDGELVWSQLWECEFNWKILLENFMEAYHHLGAHMKTLEPFLPAKGCWTEPYDPEFSAMHLPLKESMKEQILTSGDAGTPFPVFEGLDLEDCTEWWIFLGFPNFLIFSAPDRVYWYRLLPTGAETCCLMTTMIVSRKASEIADYEDLLAKEIAAGIAFHMEDMEMCEATQRGMRSLAYKQGRLSHLEEPMWHFQKYLAEVIRRAKV